MSGPPSFTPSQPPLAPGSRPGGLSAAERHSVMQRQQQQQQRLRGLEHQRKLAAVDGSTGPVHLLEIETWAGFLDRNSAICPEEHARVVEWWMRSPPLAVRGQDGGEKGDPDEADDGAHASLLGALEKVRRAHGCCATTMGHSCSLSDVGNVVAIEWANAKARLNFFASSEASTSFTEAMQQANFQRCLAYKQLDSINGSIIDHKAHAATQLHEIWTACFPTDLPKDDMEIIEKQEGPFQLPWDQNCTRLQPNAEQEILHGACRRSHGWALVEDGGTEFYQNQLVRRMVYVFLWKSEEARRLYRDKAIWRTKTRHGRALDRPTDAFLCALEELGMLGLEKWDYRLEESVENN